MRYLIQSLGVIMAMAVCFFLAACIDVDDFGSFWSQGVVDSRLEGVWAKQPADGDSVRFTHSGTTMVMEIPGEDEALLARRLNVAETSFLMLKESPKDIGGTLHRYRVSENELVFYSPRESRRKDFEDRFGSSGFLLSADNARIEKLEARQVKLLQSLDADEDWWEPASRYARVR